MSTRFDRNKLNIWVDIDETICKTPPTRKYAESVFITAVYSFSNLTIEVHLLSYIDLI